jgi:hypothetical protein
MFRELFDIDSLTFNYFQDITKEIKYSELNNDIIPENDIESYISVYLYIRRTKEPFTEKEIKEKNIDVSKFEGYKTSFLQFDKIFNIKKKFSLLELKEKAYKFFGVIRFDNDIDYGFNNDENMLFNINQVNKFNEYNDYIFIDSKFRWWAYNLILFDEIEKLNIEKGDINFNSKFFQINPVTNVKKIKYLFIVNII